MKYLFIIITLFSFIHLNAQPQNANWTFGNKNGLKFLPNGQIEQFESIINIQSSECVATMSDSLGNLLFYLYPYDTRASKLIDANHQTVENGDSVLANYTVTNGAVIVPKPNTPYLYYLYTRGGGGVWGTIKNYIVETLISTENGSPHIIYKNKILYTLEPGTNSWLSEKIAAVQHTNGKDWWVFFINHKTGNFIKLLVTENGATISEQPIPELKIDPITPNTLIGEMSFSKQGDRLAGVFMDKGIYVFDFDRCTGEIKVNKKFPIYYTQVNTFPAGLAYGLVFSSNGVYLYSSTLDSVLQLNLRTNARSFLFRQTSIPKMQLGQLELANNGKIYMANYCQYAFDSSYCHHLGVVTYPDKPYPYCQFQRLGLNLGDNVSNWGLPNMPVYAPGLPYAYAGGSQAICGGDSVQIGAPRQTCQYYSWQPIIGLSDSTSADPKAFPYVTTIYTLTTWIDGSDALSIDSVTVYVNPFANDLISIQAEPTVFTAQPYTVHFSAQGIDTTAFLCTWDFGDGQTAMGANVAHTYDSIAGYAVKLYVLTADGACADTLSYNLKLTIITGIDDKREAQVQAFQVYPNPAQNHFTVSTTLPYGTAQMTVFDAKGVQIGSYPIQNGNQTIPTNNWQNGIYLCKCVSPDGKIYTTKILILQ